MEDPKAKLAILIKDGNRLKLKYEEAKARFDGGIPLSNALREVGLDLMKSELGVKKKYTRPLATKARLRWETSPALQDLCREYEEWYNRSADFLSQVSMIVKSLKPEGNSNRLLRRLHSSRRPKRVDTRIDRAVHVMESVQLESLIYNRDIGMYRKKERLAKETLILAGRQIKGETELEMLLSSEVKTYLKICDPYVSKSTLKLLEVVPTRVSMQLLTTHFSDIRRFKDALDALRKSHSLEVLRVTVSGGGTSLHDRYILTERKGWIIGTSLKDIGKKDTSVSLIDDPKVFEERFDQYWDVPGVVVLGREIVAERL